MDLTKLTDAELEAIIAKEKQQGIPTNVPIIPAPATPAGGLSSFRMSGTGALPQDQLQAGIQAVQAPGTGVQAASPTMLPVPAMDPGPVPERGLELTKDVGPALGFGAAKAIEYGGRVINLAAPGTSNVVGDYLKETGQARAKQYREKLTQGQEFIDPYGDKPVLDAQGQPIMRPDSWWRKAVTGAGMSLPQSAIPMAAGLAVGGLTALTGVGGPAAPLVAGAVTSGLTALGWFGGGSYSEKKEEAMTQFKKQHPEWTPQQVEDAAHTYGLKHGAIEGGIEAVANPIEFITMGLGKTLTTPGKRFLAEGIKKAFMEELAAQPFERGLKSFGKNYVKTAGTEVGTEMIQGALGQQTDISAGMAPLDPKTGLPASPIDAAMDAIGPTLVSTLLMQGGAHALNVHLANREAAVAKGQDPKKVDAKIPQMSLGQFIDQLHGKGRPSAKEAGQITGEALQAGPTLFDLEAQKRATNFLDSVIETAYQQGHPADAVVALVGKSFVDPTPEAINVLQDYVYTKYGQMDKIVAQAQAQVTPGDSLLHMDDVTAIQMVNVIKNKPIKLWTPDELNFVRTQILPANAPFRDIWINTPPTAVFPDRGETSLERIKGLTASAPAKTRAEIELALQQRMAMERRRTASTLAEARAARSSSTVPAIPTASPAPQITTTARPETTAVVPGPAPLGTRQTAMLSESQKQQVIKAITSGQPIPDFALGSAITTPVGSDIEAQISRFRDQETDGILEDLETAGYNKKLTNRMRALADKGTDKALDTLHNELLPNAMDWMEAKIRSGKGAVEPKLRARSESRRPVVIEMMGNDREQVISHLTQEAAESADRPGDFSPEDFRAKLEKLADSTLAKKYAISKTNPFAEGIAWVKKNAADLVADMEDADVTALVEERTGDASGSIKAQRARLVKGYISDVTSGQPSIIESALKSLEAPGYGLDKKQFSVQEFKDQFGSKLLRLDPEALNQVRALVEKYGPTVTSDITRQSLINTLQRLTPEERTQIDLTTVTREIAAITGDNNMHPSTLTNQALMAEAVAKGNRKKAAMVLAQAQKIVAPGTQWNLSNVEFLDYDIEDPDVQKALAAHMRGQSEKVPIGVVGQHRLLASRNQLQSIIDIAMGNWNAGQEIGHEAWHNISELLLTEQQRKVVRQAYPSARNGQQADEMAAADFGRYLQEEKGMIPKSVKTIMDKIAQFFERFKNWMAKNGFQTVDDIFAKASSGQVKSEALKSGVYEENIRRLKTEGDSTQLAVKKAAASFISKAHQLISAKMGTSMDAKSFEGMLKGKVKVEEIKWTGLNTLIQEHMESGKPITKVEALERIEKLIPMPEIEVLEGPNTRYRATGYRGGNNYKEVIVRLPLSVTERNQNEPFEQGHFDFSGGKNSVLHILIDERETIDGKKILFVQEIQSDWHERGLARGYKAPYITKDTAPLIAELNESPQTKKYYELDDRDEQLTQMLWDIEHSIMEILRDAWQNETLKIHPSDLAVDTNRQMLNEDLTPVVLRPKWDASMKAKRFWEEDKDQLIKNHPELQTFLDRVLVISQERDATRSAIQAAEKDMVLLARKITQDKGIAVSWDRNNKTFVPGAEHGQQPVPDAPFSKTWQELGAKILKQIAVEGNFEGIAWSTPDMIKRKWGDHKLFDDLYGDNQKLGQALGQEGKTQIKIVEGDQSLLTRESLLVMLNDAFIQDFQSSLDNYIEREFRGSIIRLQLLTATPENSHQLKNALERYALAYTLEPAKVIEYWKARAAGMDTRPILNELTEQHKIAIERETWAELRRRASNYSFYPSVAGQVRQTKAGRKFPTITRQPKKSIYLSYAPVTTKDMAQIDAGQYLFSIQRAVGHFVSKALEFVDTKMANKMSPKEFESMLKGKVKAEEVEWTGLKDLIQERLANGKPITKEEVINLIEENLPMPTVQILEGDKTKYSGHMYEGGTDYKEVIVRLPMSVTDRQRVGPFREPHWDEWRRDGNLQAEQLADGRIFKEVATEAQELQRTIESSGLPLTDPINVARRQRQLELERLALPAIKKHTTGSNAVLHFLVDTRHTPDGKKVLFVQEIQSKWHEEGATSGYRSERTPENYQKAKQIIDEYNATQAKDSPHNKVIMNQDQIYKLTASANKLRTELRATIEDLILGGKTPQQARNAQYFGQQIPWPRLSVSAVLEFMDADPKDIARNSDAYAQEQRFLDANPKVWELKGALNHVNAEKSRRMAEMDNLMDAAKAELMVINDKLKGTSYTAARSTGNVGAALNDILGTTEASLILESPHVEPDAPFKKTWHELGAKILKQMAVKGNYDGIAWATPDMIKKKWGNLKLFDDLYGQKMGQVLGQKGTISLQAEEGPRKPKTRDAMIVGLVDDFSGMMGDNEGNFADMIQGWYAPAAVGIEDTGQVDPDHNPALQHAMVQFSRFYGVDLDLVVQAYNRERNGNEIGGEWSQMVRQYNDHLRYDLDDEQLHNHYERVGNETIGVADAMEADQWALPNTPVPYAPITGKELAEVQRGQYLFSAKPVYRDIFGNEIDAKLQEIGPRSISPKAAKTGELRTTGALKLATSSPVVIADKNGKPGLVLLSNYNANLFKNLKDTVPTVRHSGWTDMVMKIVDYQSKELGTKVQGPLTPSYTSPLARWNGYPPPHSAFFDTKGKLIGSFRLDMSDASHQTAQLDDLRVFAPYRKQGAATQIMPMAERMAKEHGFTMVMVHPDPTIPWLVSMYEKMGYRKAGTAMIKRIAAGETPVVQSKEETPIPPIQSLKSAIMVEGQMYVPEIGGYIPAINAWLAGGKGRTEERFASLVKAGRVQIGYTDPKVPESFYTQEEVSQANRGVAPEDPVNKLQQVAEAPVINKDAKQVVKRQFSIQPRSPFLDLSENETFQKMVREYKGRELTHLVPVKDTDLTTAQRVLLTPWWLQKQHPEFKELINIELQREETREELYRTLTHDAKNEGMNKFLVLPHDQAEELFQKVIVRADREQKRYEDSELYQMGLNDAQVEAYHDWNTAFDRAYKAISDTYDEMTLLPHREKPYFKKLAEVYTGKKDVATAKQELLGSQYLEDFNRDWARLEKAAKTIKEMRSEMGKLKAYMPHIRDDGEWVVHVTDQKGIVRHAERAATKNQIAFITNELKKDYRWKGMKIEATLDKPTPESIFQSISDASTETFVKRAVAKLEAKQKLTEEEAQDLADALKDTLVDTLKARGFGRHMVARYHGGEEFITGYKTTGGKEIFNDYMQGLSGFLTKQKAAYALYQHLGTFDSKAKPMLYEDGHAYVKDLLRNQGALDRLSGKARMLAFGYYLAGNLKSAAMQFSQNFITGIPILSQYTDNATEKYTQAMQDITKGNITEEESKQLHKALDRGIATAQYFNEVTGRIKKSTVNQTMWSIIDFTSKPFQGMEIWNRKSAFIAAYRVARNEMEMGPETAFTFARDFVYDTHYLMGKANLPSWARGGDVLGTGLRTAYTFRSFTHNYMQSLYDSYKKAPGGLKALRVIGNSMAWTFLFGGALSLPFLGDALDDLEKLTGTPYRHNMRKALRGMGGEMIERFGLNGIPGLFGIDLSGSLAIGLPSIPGINENPADTVAGVWGGLADKFIRTGKALHQNDYFLAAEKASPAAIENILKAYRMHTEGGRTQSGRPITDPQGNVLKLGGGEALTQSVGFKPQRMSAAGMEHASYTNVEKYWDSKKQHIYTMMRLANNNEDILKVMEMANKFNQDVTPLFGVVKRIDYGELNKMRRSKLDKKYRAFDNL